MDALLAGQVPFSQEAEEAVIGAIVVNPDMWDAVSFLKPDDFYITRHGYIWDALARIVERKEAIDNVTLREELRAMGRLTDVGGPAYITQLSNSVPTSMHAEVYGRIVQRAAIRRRGLACADEIKGLFMDEEAALEWSISQAAKAFARIEDANFTVSRETWLDTISKIMDEVAYRMDNPEQPIGLPTGWSDVDNLLGGLQKSDLIILAARPGVGKTSMMLGIALNAMSLYGARVGFESQEMSRSQIGYRMLSMESEIDLLLLRTGKLSPEQHSKFVKASGKVGVLPYYVEDATGRTPEQILRDGLRWKREGGLDLLMVDYLQILSSGGAFKRGDRVNEVSYFADSLKQVARELNVPVFCAAQINRDVESREDKRPMLSDLRESGAIEQAADIVAFIYREHVYDKSANIHDTELIVAKHRNGPTGTIKLHWQSETTKFSSAKVHHVDLRPLSMHQYARSED